MGNIAEFVKTAEDIILDIKRSPISCLPIDYYQSRKSTDVFFTVVYNKLLLNDVIKETLIGIQLGENQKALKNLKPLFAGTKITATISNQSFDSLGNNNSQSFISPSDPINTEKTSFAIRYKRLTSTGKFIVWFLGFVATVLTIVTGLIAVYQFLYPNSN